MIRLFPLRLVASRMLAPSVRHLAFERADGEATAFVPGQFIQFHFDYADGTPTKRSYSIATRRDDPATAGLIEIAVSYVAGGAATERLAALREGERIDASGPYGRFCLHDADRNARYLLVATGTGVTPYRAMLPDLARHIAGRPCEVALIYGARSEAELLYAGEFEAFAARTPGFGFHPCFSRVPRHPARPGDRTGRVQAALTELAPDPLRDIAYLCGNPDMVDESFALLQQAGLPVRQIRREKYLSSR
ncbi:MAG TPA: FAD-binding oxidoreductase [Dokdonella sp.]|uniref:FAD-binding oxidoreductase n=1 Tax=Dokdonella sp. TaxID=2291710 RepID=UPI002CD292AE|nr:FAD-binding oxidoreductase [Dokdonella sp.]HUD42843.1 FAD-binding oxidoreductase [Dokdonella sp.]